MVRDGLTEKVAFEEEYVGDKRVTHADVWGKAFQAEGQQVQGSWVGM